METVMNDKKKKEVTRPNLKYQRDKDREMVKGIFRFHEVPGGHMAFSIKLYKEDPVENYSFYDGEVYTIPLGVARHLNKNGWYPEYEYMRNENMQGVGHGMRIATKVRRFSFQSLEFIDSEDLTPATSVSVAEQMPIIL